MVVHLITIQVGLEVVKLVRIRLFAQDRRPIVRLEGLPDRLGVVLEIEHERVVLLRVGAVQPRERLDGLDAGERLVHVHGVEQRLVVPGLEFVGTDQEAVGIFLDRVRDEVAREAVERRFGHLLPAELGLAGKGDDGLVGALPLLQVVAEGVEILDGTLDAAGHDHGPRLAADLLPGEHLLVEVIDHDFRLHAGWRARGLDVAA